VHFTAAGYHRLSTVLFADLMRLFEEYQKVRPEARVIP